MCGEIAEDDGEVGREPIGANCTLCRAKTRSWDLVDPDTADESGWRWSR